MTTIAVRDGIVAFDSRMTSGDGIMPDRVQKGWISKKHPVIFTIFGTVSTTYAAAMRIDKMAKLPWDNPNVELPKLDDESGIIVAHKDGRVFSIEQGGWMETTGPFWACGTGAMGATVAMLMGASAVEAVGWAAKVDHNTGLPVHELRLVDIKVRPKRKRKAK